MQVCIHSRISFFVSMHVWCYICFCFSSCVIVDLLPPTPTYELGVVQKRKHIHTNTIILVKVRWFLRENQLTSQPCQQRWRPHPSCSFLEALSKNHTLPCVQSYNENPTQCPMICDGGIFHAIPFLLHLVMFIIAHSSNPPLVFKPLMFCTSY
jgi:hypothetical protein